MNRFYPRGWRTPLYALPALSLAACSGGDLTGEGSGPTRLTVQLNGVSSTVTSVECTALVLNAVVLFEGDGGSSEADYASRVVWSSSDDTVVSVSNGELTTGQGSSVYAAGTIVARRPGTATITADYLEDGLSDRIDVSVLDLTRLEITPAKGLLAPDSRRQYTLTGYTGTGYPVSGLESETVWALAEVSAPADLLASGSAALVTALEGPEEQPFTLEAQLPSCGRSAAQELIIAVPERVELATEQPQGAPLPLGVYESLQLLAVFADGSTQNLSEQSEAEQREGASGDGSLSLYASGDEDDRYLLAIEEAGESLQYRICYTPLDLCADSAVITAAELDAPGLRVSEDSITLTYPDEAQLQVYGQFEDGVERPVTRSVTWSNSNAAAVTLGVGVNTAGQLQSLNVDQDARIDITLPALSDDSLQVDLRVYSTSP